MERYGSTVHTYLAHSPNELNHVRFGPLPAGGGGRHNYRDGNMKKAKKKNDVLTADEVAELLRINRNTVYEAFHRGEIPGVRIGRVIRFSRKRIREWLEGARR